MGELFLPQKWIFRVLVSTSPRHVVMDVTVWSKLPYRLFRKVVGSTGVKNCPIGQRQPYILAKSKFFVARGLLGVLQALYSEWWVEEVLQSARPD